MTQQQAVTTRLGKLTFRGKARLTASVATTALAVTLFASPLLTCGTASNHTASVVRADGPPTDDWNSTGSRVATGTHP
ncbi:hypothetical protein ACICHK_41780 (plasmid) [Streptomyces sp. AHU1]|uniref:hypothetical protein n=1 Tax=Streptomyces sp. AHU1 TaxID=3377215 RepID=UPI0038781851